MQYVLDTFDLHALKDRKVGALSSGQKTLVGLAKSLINKPRLLFLDECTVGLDPETAIKTRKILKDYHDSYRPTIIFTSHYMSEVEMLCDQVAFLKGGKIIKNDTTKNIKNILNFIKIEFEVDAVTDSLLNSINHLNGQRQNNHFSVLVREDEYRIVLNTIMHMENVSFSDLSIKKPSLEDVFLDVIKKVG